MFINTEKNIVDNKQNLNCCNDARFFMRDGIKLALHSWLSQKPKAILFFVAGMHSHAGWLFEAGPYFADRSISVFCLDRRGTGIS